MSKYSNGLKLKVIKYYFEEPHSYSECCKKFNILSNKSILTWIKNTNYMAYKEYLRD